jgi:hypothetical protein
MSLKKVFKLMGVTNVDYLTKEGKKEQRKVVDLLRFERDAFGNVVSATIQSRATGSFFPHRFNRQGELVDNEIYKNLADTVGKQLYVTTKRYDTSPFNFASDSDDAEPRLGINVLVPYSDSESETVISERLKKQAEYQLRGLAVDIYDDGAHIATSTTEDQWNARREEAQTKAESLRGIAPAKFDAAQTEAEFRAANPDATDEDVELAVMEAEDAFGTVNSAN